MSRRFRILLRQPLSSNVPLACSWPPAFSFSVSPLPITIPLNKQVTARTLRSRLIGRNQLIRPPALKAIHSLLKVSRIVPSNNLRDCGRSKNWLRVFSIERGGRFISIFANVWSTRHPRLRIPSRSNERERERERAWPYPRLPSLSLDPLSEGCTNIKVKFLALSFLLAERDRFNQKEKNRGKDIPIIGVERAHFLSWPLDHVRDIISSFLSRIPSNLHFPRSSGSRR